MYNLITKEFSPDYIFPIRNNKIDCNVSFGKDIGTGQMQIVHLEEGLFVRKWDCSFNDKVEWFRSADIYEERNYYSLNYYLTPGTLILQNPFEPDAHLNNIWNTIFASGDTEYKMEIFPRKPMKCLSICFDRSWLERYTASAGKREANFISLLLKTNPFFIFESYNSVETKLIKEIYNEEKYYSGFIYLKSRAIGLISEFISKISLRESLVAPGYVDHYDCIIKAVEKRIVSLLHASLPPISELAREFALSESTLKRNFKKVYGKSITEYYLGKKMEKAQDLLYNQRKSVNETAYMLGYEKASHFIAMFKKFAGCSPGTIKRQLPPK